MLSSFYSFPLFPISFSPAKRTEFFDELGRDLSHGGSSQLLTKAA